MQWPHLHLILLILQRIISLCGVLIILSGVIHAIYKYLFYVCRGLPSQEGARVNLIRLQLGRILILGLEFIVAADLISTTTTPDYYALGMVAIVVAIRTLLSFSINKELASLSKEELKETNIG